MQKKIKDAAGTLSRWIDFAGVVWRYRRDICKAIAAKKAETARMQTAFANVSGVQPKDKDVFAVTIKDESGVSVTVFGAQKWIDCTSFAHDYLVAKYGGRLADAISDHLIRHKPSEEVMKEYGLESRSQLRLLLRDAIWATVCYAGHAGLLSVLVLE